MLVVSLVASVGPPGRRSSPLARRAASDQCANHGSALNPPGALVISRSRLFIDTCIHVSHERSRETWNKASKVAAPRKHCRPCAACAASSVQPSKGLRPLFLPTHSFTLPQPQLLAVWNCSPALRPLDSIRPLYSDRAFAQRPPSASARFSPSLHGVSEYLRSYSEGACKVG